MEIRLVFLILETLQSATQALVMFLLFKLHMVNLVTHLHNLVAKVTKHIEDFRCIGRDGQAISCCC